jgi:hypothetical protein
VTCSIIAMAGSATGNTVADHVTAAVDARRSTTSSVDGELGNRGERRRRE